MFSSPYDFPIFDLLDPLAGYVFSDSPQVTGYKTSIFPLRLPRYRSQANLKSIFINFEKFIVTTTHCKLEKVLNSKLMMNCTYIQVNLELDHHPADTDICTVRDSRLQDPKRGLHPKTRPGGNAKVRL